MLGSVFTECRLRPVTFVEVDFTLAVLGDCDLRGVDLSDPTLWTTAALRGARIDIEQALAYAAAHGLDVHGE
jgi:uncharacterized protein YjbI with pentapeptide repeats